MPKATESITYSKRSNSQVLIFSFAFQVNPIYKLANMKGVSREKVLDKSGNLTKENVRTLHYLLLKNLEGILVLNAGMLDSVACVSLSHCSYHLPPGCLLAPTLALLLCKLERTWLV